MCTRCICPLNSTVVFVICCLCDKGMSHLKCRPPKRKSLANYMNMKSKEFVSLHFVDICLRIVWALSLDHFFFSYTNMKYLFESDRLRFKSVGQQNIWFKLMNLIFQILKLNFERIWIVIRVEWTIYYIPCTGTFLLVIIMRIGMLNIFRKH